MNSTKDNQERPLSDFLSPRFWPVWIGIGLMRLASLLPFRLVVLIGDLIGRLAYRIAGRRRSIAERNIALCFSDLTPKQQNQLVKEHFRSVGIGLTEMAYCWWASPARLSKLAEYQGLEHLHQAQAQGQGVVLLAGHFTTIEIGGVILTQEVKVDAMYRKFENPLFEEIMRRRRSHWADKVIPRGDFRQMLRSLKDGRTVLYMPDQAYVRQNSLQVPFFGHPAPTSTGTERLVKHTKAQVVPFLPLRKADGSGYLLKIFPALESFPGDDSLENATRINQVFEEHATLVPSQYLWIHRRFKGQKGVYD